MDLHGSRTTQLHAQVSHSQQKRSAAKTVIAVIALATMNTRASSKRGAIEPAKRQASKRARPTSWEEVRANQTSSDDDSDCSGVQRLPGACSAHFLGSVHAPCASEAHGVVRASCTPPVTITAPARPPPSPAPFAATTAAHSDSAHARPARAQLISSGACTLPARPKRMASSEQAVLRR